MNSELTGTVDTVFDNVAGNAIEERILESARISGLAKAGFEAINVLRGKTSMSNAGKNILRTVANTAAVTGITAFLFEGL
ncbi:MAG: hypothetical protein L3J05_03835 [Robiginitomaculum sp.]|nr:hypothetical protein [Robiginitomaculum sp.]